jgi:MOSC domain-containing protein YiiM
MFCKVMSLQLGMPRSYSSEAREWSSGIYKSAVRVPTQVTTTGFVGDGQADLKNHGGPDKAVLMYSALHYNDWREQLGLDESQMPFGSFGENLTVDSVVESDVCVGDVLSIGASVIVQVSQPRQPCWKLAKHLDRADMVARVETTGRTGWYLRVLSTGVVGPNDTASLLERPFPSWTVARCSRVMSRRKADPASAALLAECALLSASWRATLSAFVASGVVPDPSARTKGD